LKVLFAASEFAPLVKTGGLADVCGALPRALCGLGQDVRVLLPAYPAVRAALPGPPAVLARIDPYAGLPGACLLQAQAADGTALILVDSPELFDRPGNPYLGPDGADWPDNARRFGLFSRVAAVLGSDASPLSWRPQVVHAHDWQAGLAPIYRRYGALPGAPVVVTVHNLAYQGNFHAGVCELLGLPPDVMGLEAAEFYGQFSFLKGGLACAQAITTVSPTYAREICTEALGFGLQGLLQARAGELTGILNGVDTQLWDPARDPYLAQPYDADSMTGKRLNKRALQARLGLPLADGLPVIGVVSRLVTQKGMDLVADILPQIAAAPAQVVIQGLGDRALQERLAEVALAHPDRIAVRISFHEDLAHLIEAGADIFLMPSRFEPCGMNQMYSQRYGTLPVACRTGGLADSICNWTAQTFASGEASGFLCAPGDSDELLACVRRAIAAYGDPAAWAAVQRQAMQRDFSWDASARKYLEVYRSVQ
jgi:starch synthase